MYEPLGLENLVLAAGIGFVSGIVGTLGIKAVFAFKKLTGKKHHAAQPHTATATHQPTSPPPPATREDWEKHGVRPGHRGRGDDRRLHRPVAAPVRDGHAREPHDLGLRHRLWPDLWDRDHPVDAGTDPWVRPAPRLYNGGRLRPVGAVGHLQAALEGRPRLLLQPRAIWGLLRAHRGFFLLGCASTWSTNLIPLTL